MKIFAVCGHGLGSSFMLEKNIKTVMTKIGKEADVSHIDLASVTNNMADIFVVGQDLAPGIAAAFCGLPAPITQQPISSALYCRNSCYATRDCVSNWILIIAR